MQISRADADDVDRLADLWVDLAAEQREHGTHLHPGGNRATVRQDLLRRTITGEVLVARSPGDGEEGEDGEIIGFVSFGTETTDYSQDVDRGTVFNLYVVPERRGEGIGSRLLAAAEGRLREAGVDVVALEAMADNEAARRFYRRDGYHPHRVEMEKRVGIGGDGDGSAEGSPEDAGEGDGEDGA